MAKAATLQFSNEGTKATRIGRERLRESLEIVKRIARVENDKDADDAAQFLEKVVTKHCKDANGDASA